MGIIRAFKATYEKYLLRALEEFENGLSTVKAFKTINIKNAIIFSKQAWDEISAETIINCWTKTGLIDSDNFEHVIVSKDENTNDIDEIIIKIITENPLSANEYIDVENDLFNTETELNVDTIIEKVLQSKNDEDDDVEAIDTDEIQS